MTNHPEPFDFRNEGSRYELALLKAERDELRNALEACVERLIASQPPTGGRTEAVINQAKAVLAKGKP